MEKLREHYLRRAELFLTPSHHPQLSLHSHLWKLRDSTAITLKVWSPSTDGDPEPPKFQDAIAQDYVDAQIGDRYGPSWSTHWFKVQVQIPKDGVWKGERIVFRWEADCEALVWSSTGVPLIGFSEQERDEFELTKSAEPGEKFDFYIEMVVNGMFGTGGDDNKWVTLRTSEIVVVNESVRKYFETLRILLDLAKSNQSVEGEQALTALDKSINSLDLRNVDSTIDHAQSIMDDFLAHTGGRDRFKVFAVGNCHIDTAWLWRYRETRRKCARSWSSQLRLLEQFPSYTFACPQMVQLEWLKHDYPALFKEIQVRVSEGRFVPIGGSWVEMDGNMPNGESFVRHLLYGQKFMKENFGMQSDIFWLPDTFGYNAQLPQLIRLAGMKYFVTQKLSWSSVNKFPHHSFHWEGLDGSRVLTHFPPADTYTSNASVKDVLKSQDGYKDRDRSCSSLLLYGHGDGGGGPTAAMIRRLEAVKDVNGLPKVEMTTTDKFFEALEKDKEDLLSWQGELYLELHRGTLTSQAKIKYYNRKCEGLMREAELISSLLSVVLFSKGKKSQSYPASEIERLWKVVLLNQFHDVLPGSSIEGVYHDASKMYQQVELEASRIRELAIRALFGMGKHHIELHPSDHRKEKHTKSSIVFFNSVPVERSDIVLVPFDPNPNSPQPGVLAVENVPALSMVSLDKTFCSSTTKTVSVQQATDGFFMENEFVRVVVDGLGRVTSHYDKVNKRETIDSPANSVWMYEDRPNAWDAWDIDVSYEAKGRCVDGGTVSVEIGMEGPVLASIIRKVQLSPTSTMTQIISLSCLSAQLDFYCSVDWSESHQLLRILFPVTIRSEHATYETAFGQVRRPTHRNTSWDAAKFEVCGHRYVDLSEHGYGVALLNDCKYGFSVKGNVMGVSMLRSPKYPDPTCDQSSRHISRLALFPHTGSCEDASVVGAAYRFNNPLRWTSVPSTSYDPAWLDTPFISFTNPNGPTSTPKPCLLVDTIKLPEEGPLDGSVLIVRVYEPYGARGTANMKTHPLMKVDTVAVCNILEIETPDLAPVSKDSSGEWSVSYKPFQIITLRLAISPL